MYKGGGIRCHADQILTDLRKNGSVGLRVWEGAGTSRANEILFLHLIFGSEGDLAGDEKLRGRGTRTQKLHTPKKPYRF